MGHICICGLDHDKPLPDRYKDPPIVFSSDHEDAVCHACGSWGPKERIFWDFLVHELDCKYIKSLEGT